MTLSIDLSQAPAWVEEFVKRNSFFRHHRADDTHRLFLSEALRISLCRVRIYAGAIDLVAHTVSRSDLTVLLGAEILHEGSVYAFSNVRSSMEQLDYGDSSPVLVIEFRRAT